MKTNFKFKKSLITSIILVGLVFIPLFSIKADSGVLLYVTPSSGNYNVGDLINALVKINTEGETVNAVKATLSFNENLKVQSISKSGSILGLWIEDPSYDNSSRIISFGGAGAGTTYKGSEGTIISIIFKAEKAGKGIISFSSSLVKYGATTIGVDSATGASYTINVLCNCTSWQDRACGGNDCSFAQRFQTRSCTPSGCSLKERCIEDSSCVTAPVSEEEEKEEEEEVVVEEETDEGVGEEEEVVLSGETKEDEEGVSEKEDILPKEPSPEPKPSFSQILTNRGFLAAIGGMTFNSRAILIIIGIIVLGLIILWLIRRKKKLK